MAIPADTTLWERARAGDADAFGLLYGRHARSVQSFLLWRVTDPSLAEDLTSVVFLEAWRGRERSRVTTHGTTAAARSGNERAARHWASSTPSARRCRR